MISIFADSSPDHANASAITLDEPPAVYFLEVDSPFFQLSKETILLAPESLGGGMTARNTARGAASGPGGPGGGVGNNSRPRDLPKKAELLQPGGHRGTGGGATSSATAAAGAEGAAAGGSQVPLPETNSTLVNFFPRAAGTYTCKLIVKRRMKHTVDVRCVDIAASVDAPRNATALVFRAPAGQKITQEVSKSCFRGLWRGIEDSVMAKRVQE